MSVKRGRTVVGTLIALLVSAAGLPAHAANPYPPFISAGADWLTSVNYFRSMSGLAPVVEDPSLSPGAYNHSCYMLLNDIAHEEVPGAPGYTASGDAAGRSGNVAVIHFAVGCDARHGQRLSLHGENKARARGEQPVAHGDGDDGRADAMGRG